MTRKSNSSKKAINKAIEARNALGRIRVLARKRRMEIHEIRKQRKADKKKGESNE
jgi:hypothetical protein